MKKTNLPSSLQNDIGTILSPRDQLKQKLREKINKSKEITNKPSAQMKQKLEKDAKKEKKEVDNDPRVTLVMKNYFIKALQSYPGLDLANPVEILNNPDEYKLEYYNFATDLLKKSNNDPSVLNNPYCDYLKEILGLS
jgi:hypothetical protein